MTWFRCGLALFAASCVLAFDNKEFRKCSDLAFCKINRQLSENATPSPFLIKPESVQASGSKVSGLILNTVAEAEFSFDLEILSHPSSTVRWTVDEAAADSKRFRPPFILEDDITGGPLTVVEHSMERIVVSAGSILVEIYYSPLRVDFLRDGKLFVRANDRNLFNFEHHRPRSENDLSELWEDRFKSHVETKPKGPASVGIDFTFVGSKYVYGIPEHATSFALKPTRGDGISSEPYRLYNLDVFEYQLDSPFGLYGAVPLMMAHNEDGTSAVFLLNTSEMYVDVATDERSTKTHWYAESGLLDIFVFLGPGPKDIAQGYATLTGHPHLPPLFSLAYHQCRWNYKDETDVDHVDDKFDEFDIPYDVLWLDIEHTDGKKYFTWDDKLFPTPKRMQDDLALKGRSMVTIADPHIKRDSSYPLHNRATQESLYIKAKDGKDFEGNCWPGPSSYLDFLNPKAREAYAQAYIDYEGATDRLHTWNDMNEPSVFNGPEMTMPKDALHDGGNVEHRDMHNMYGLLHHMSSYHGLRQRLNGKRPFLLTRSFFSGSQRFTGVWTGDNMAKWDHLAAAQPMLLSLSVGGMPFVGADVGGFFYNPDSELLVRWYQAGAYHPFFRAHAHIDTKRREPYLFAEPYVSHIREAIRSRYRLLPYWYTVAFQTNQTGIPMMRPLVYEFPDDANVFATEQQYMVGDAILVAPVSEAGKTSQDVYLPGSQGWYHFESGAKAPSGHFVADAPANRIPVFQRGGTIIPKRERARRSSTLMARDPYTLVVALDEKGKASGELFQDDGETFDFVEGKYIHRRFTFENSQLSNLNIHTGSLSYGPELTIQRILVRGLAHAPAAVSLLGGDSLSFVWHEEAAQLTIRKPGVFVTKEWAIRVD